MRNIVISFNDSDFREISRRAFNENQSEAEWVYDRIQAIIQDVE